jgi:hypothetical protein
MFMCPDSANDEWQSKVTNQLPTNPEMVPDDLLSQIVTASA